MTRSIATIALAVALAAAIAIPAEAGRHARGHHAHAHYGPAYARSGPWIVSVVGAARDADHGNCYTRFGRQFCE